MPQDDKPETAEQAAARVAAASGENAGEKPAAPPAGSKTGGGTDGKSETHVHLHHNAPPPNSPPPPPEKVGEPGGAGSLAVEILKIACAAALAVSGIAGLLRK